MKLHLPFVTRKAHAKAMAKARTQAELDNTYLIDQLAQAQRVNARLTNTLRERAAEAEAAK